MKRLFLTLFLLLCLLTSTAQGTLRFRCVEMNCENLFDTVHDYGKDDMAFLPDGTYAWNSQRYWRKQSALSRIFLEIGGLQPVDIIGLCEVENDSVLTHLTRRTRLAALGYEYALTDSRDVRGIDVALLYQPLTFHLVDKHCYSVPYDAEKERPTRDILHCTGVLLTGDTLDVMVVHFPSRRGGEKLASDYRRRAAEVVVSAVDSLRSQRPDARVLIMGDCNDEPRDRSLSLIADAGFRNVSAGAVAMGSERYAKQLRTICGTYYFQKSWSRIDNILVSHAAAERYRVGDAFIFAPDYLLESDVNGFPMPFRLYRGPAYHGGVSDHLPLVVDLWY